ncbi:MAG: translation initiation factor IF-2, partial [Chloroflexi bacterium]|nr:translation initiation factor IF-2 [Chloroflexota bacterium]
MSGILSQSHVDTVKTLMRFGVMATVNEVIDFETAARVAGEFDIQVLKPREREESTAGTKVGIDDDLTEETGVTRPPIVTVLGHVDHGKTTVLDSIRGSSIVSSEAGGITQSIGAYQVDHDGHLITFIDTPGHQAFTAMRASGAQVTDMAVLVVAADDGVMPQTIEAIDHIRAAGVPMIIAINKMDLPGADADRLKGQLTEHDIVVEDYGGDVVSVSLSALKGEGIEELLESILLVSEVSEFKANPDRPGMGVVIESNVDRTRGPIATLLVRAGTVCLGDNIVAGTTRGHIRAMTDGFGADVQEAGPSTPIQVLGLNAVPNVGDQFDVIEGERTARQL